MTTFLPRRRVAASPAKLAPPLAASYTLSLTCFSVGIGPLSSEFVSHLDNLASQVHTA
jgi:hypothetical protein